MDRRVVTPGRIRSSDMPGEIDAQPGAQPDGPANDFVLVTTVTARRLA
jgi:hypothetical protein